MKLEILYPVFLEASKHTEDLFWKQIFEDLSYGVSPYGSYFSKGFFCCSYKGKEFSYKVEGTDSVKIFEDIHGLLANKMGVTSSNDRARKIQDFERIRDEYQEIRNSKWNCIKKKTSRDFIIENFIVDMKNLHSLSDSEARKLNAIINIGMLFKTITHKDIEYESGKIRAINGIEFQDSKVVFSTSSLQPVDSIVSIIFQEKETLSDIWRKYLKENFSTTTGEST
jgi:hypothetical protein